VISEARLPITVILPVKNEAPNLDRCLQACKQAARVIVIDSHSSDGTCEIAAIAGVEVVQFVHTGGYPKKRQWALENLPIETEWVLFLDADEVVTETLWSEIESAIASPAAKSGYLIRKGFHFLGRRFRFGGFSHQAVLLIRKGRGRFEQLVEVPGDSLDMEVHERMIVEGDIGILRSPLIHEDFKGLEAYIDRHNRYSTWEAFIRSHSIDTGSYGQNQVQPRLFGNVQERRRWVKRFLIRIPGEPWLWFFYHFFFRLGFLEGRRGLIAAQIRRQYIANARAKMFELHLRGQPSGACAAVCRSST
jgi:glycosyltransferase involved in cell wall biosynthesis